MKESSFDYYDNSRPVFYFLKYVFIINSVYNIPVNTIFTSEGFEDFPSMRSFFKDEQGNLKRNSLVSFRIAILLVSYLFTFFSDNLSAIFGIGGGLFCPLLSFIFPILWAWWFDSKRHSVTKPTAFYQVMDWSTLIYGGIVTVFANIYGVKEFFSKVKTN